MTCFLSTCDVEELCECVYSGGERYKDGTAAIGARELFKVTE